VGSKINLVKGLQVKGKGTIVSINGKRVHSRQELIDGWDAITDGMVRLTVK
jgi:hypothetical protein